MITLYYRDNMKILQDVVIDKDLKTKAKVKKLSDMLLNEEVGSGRRVVAVRKPMAKRLMKAADMAAVLSSKESGIIRRTSMIAKTAPHIMPRLMFIPVK